VITVHDFEGVLGRPLDTSFELSQFHGHGSWLACEVGPRTQCEAVVEKRRALKICGAP
jgi:hypothetical protein